MFIPIHDTNALESIRLHYATIGLIALNVLVFLAVELDLLGVSDVFAYGLIPATFDGSAVRDATIAAIPEPATLLTYAFLHADIWHLAGNMVFLWVFGDNVEDAIGHAGFLVFYALCAAAGGLAHVWMSPGSEVPLIGASGAVAGVIAAYLILHPRVRVWVLVLGRIPLRLPAFLLLGGWILVQVWYAVDGGETQVGWWAHVGGIAAGALLIVVLRRRGVALFDRDLPAP